MNELLLKLEQIARDMPPGPLLLAGIISISLGLFLWLGGLRYCWLVVGLLGGCAGAGVGLWVANWFELQAPISMLIGATVLALGAILIQHTIILALATLIFATICGGGYVGYLMDTGRQLLPEGGSSQQNLSDSSDPSTQTIQDKIAQGQKIYDGVRQIREKIPQGIASQTQPDVTVPGDPQLGGQLNDGARSDLSPSQEASSGIEQIYQQLKPYLSGHHGQLFLWCLAGGVVGLILAHLLKTVIMGLCCSAVGSAGTIGGVIILMMAKGAAVADGLAAKPKLLPALFLIMVIFGWIVQLFLSGSSRKNAARPSESQEE